MLLEFWMCRCFCFEYFAIEIEYRPYRPRPMCVCLRLHVVWWEVNVHAYDAYTHRGMSATTHSKRAVRVLNILIRVCAGFIVVFILDICSKISATEAFFFCWNVSSWIQLVRRASHFSRSSSTLANMLWTKKVRKKSCALGSENEQRGIGLGEFSST